MIAYNTKDLHNQLLHKNAEEALFYNFVDEATHIKITQAYPIKLYTPNYFIRFGLGLLTLIAGLFVSFLLGLMFGVSSNGSISVFLFFMAAICYVALELLVNVKEYYNAGIDNILMILTVIFLFAGCFFCQTDNPYILASAACFIACLWMAYRFVDAFCGMLAYVFFYLYVFFLLVKLGHTAETFGPFILMMVSIIIYSSAKAISCRQALRYHKYCAECILFLAIVSFYISGNYYIVDEMGNSNLIDFRDKATPIMASGWIFWIFTICVPPAYLIYGIGKKSLLFIRTGVVFIATSILTIRYYHTFLPVDTALIIAGLILIVISYMLIKYLRSAKNGFTFSTSFYSSSKLRDGEALIAVQAFGGVHHTSSPNDVEFGGGSSGGAGASGTF